MESVFELRIVRDEKETVKYFDTEESANKEVEFYREIYLPEVKISFKIKKIKKSIDNH